MRRAAVSLALMAAGACSGGGSSTGRGTAAPRDGAAAPGSGADTTESLAADEVADDDSEPRELEDGDGAEADEPGTLRVKVVWPRPAAALLRSPGRNPCGAAIAPPLQVEPAGVIADRYATERMVALRGAVVVLEGVPPSEDAAEPPEVAVRGCALAPRAVAVPRGAALALVNTDARRHELAIAPLGQAEPFAVAPLPVVGAAVAVPLEPAGVFAVTARGAPRSIAYAVVVDSEYAAVTDAAGEAVFRGLEPGGYTARIWHPPVTPDGAPVTARVEVEVEAGAAARAVARLGS